MERSTPNTDVSGSFSRIHYSDPWVRGRHTLSQLGLGVRYLHPEAHCSVLLGMAPCRLRIGNEKCPHQCLRSVRLQLGSHYYKLKNTNRLEATEGQNHRRWGNSASV